ncbi:RidA family protein [Nocardiopsis alba]|jgi:enamine deaminase RidA (YjgF/YER057c/UK114 family)|uniref:RidA family protein n=1 Tax=Nocardiopsis alba TaxID=53437 RepID=UPI0033C79E16
MAVALFTPEGMMGETLYHHVAVATGTRHVHVAGQVAREGEREDFAGQVASALRETATGLAGAGAGFSDVVRLTFYVTNRNDERVEELMAGIERVAEEIGLPRPLPPASLIGVEGLYRPEILVEVEATAVLE